jgi:hypothetical protein
LLARSLGTTIKHTGAWRDPAPLSEDVDIRAPPDHFPDWHFPGIKDAGKLMSDGKTLPVRFLCRVCGACVATGDNLQKSEDDVLVFSRLHCSPDMQATKTVSCGFCGSALGSRGNNAYMLRKERVSRGNDRLEILVCSLKEKEISEVAPVLQEAFPQSNVTPRVLQKAELRGFELKPMKPHPDFVVVVHRNEGRALLTDRNGFYHDVLGSAWQQTRGNVLVVLTRTETKGGADLFDVQLLQNLSTKGDQPTIGAISACGRVLTWESSPSKPQIQQLQLLSEKAYFREPPSVVHGIPVGWAKRNVSKADANASWCSLL